MKNIPDMIKGNPIVVGSIVVALLSLAALLFFVRPAGKKFIAEMEGRKQDESKLASLMKTPVTIPGKTPDAPPETLNMTVNRSALEAISEVYENMNDQFKKVFDKATAINQANHKPMLDGLLPETTQDAPRYRARTEYMNALRDTYGRPSSANPFAPRLNAAGPISGEKLDEELLKVQNKFLAGFFPAKTESELSEADRKRLNEQRQATAMKLVTDHAKRIGIYVVEDEESEGYPYHRGAWIRETNLPQMRDVWEGQMALWIQQDLIRAIMIANSTKETKDAEVKKLESVLNAPVKQIVNIQVYEGYVGINSTGAVGRLGQARDGIQQPTDYGAEMLQRADATKILDDVKNYNPDKPLPEAFNVSLTGRVGNAIYDVRHVKLTVIADYQKLPELFEAIGKVNFMTVLNTYVRNIDEYEYLQAGYVFGEKDCVEVEMIIETIWLRQWTSALMPKEIKDELGIVEKAPDAAGTATTPTPAPAPSNAP